MGGFLAMGGYGAFVWGAFGITFLVLTLLLLASVRSLKGNEERLAALEKADATAEGEEAAGAAA